MLTLRAFAKAAEDVRETLRTLLHDGFTLSVTTFSLYVWVIERAKGFHDLAIVEN
jgi:hypothetical protein